MSTDPILNRTNATSWENEHEIFTQRITAYYDAVNGNSGDQRADYNKMTALIQGLIDQCIAQNTTLRAFGSGWSFEKIATTHGTMLATEGLDMILDLQAQDIQPGYANAQNLCLAQCGIKIHKLNAYLKSRSLSLKTSGASDGQSIVGALSTCTHGGSYDIGAIPDFVLGMHIIVGPNKHVWIERSSNPVVSADLIQSLGTVLISDDAIFNAAVVSFGSFGFIHSLLIETEELYNVELVRTRLKYTDVSELMTTMDFTKTEALFPKVEGKYPFHFQVLFNPYKMEEAVVTYAYKANFAHKMASRPILQEIGHLIYKLISFWGTLDPHLLPGIINQILTRFYGNETQSGTLGEIFTADGTPDNNYSTAMGFSLSDIPAVIEVLKTNTRQHPKFAGLYSFRFVKSTAATLGFTNQGKVTCVLELDGVQSSMNYKFYQDMWQKLRDANIHFTFHWGKMSDLSPVILQNVYGPKLQAWQDIRKSLLDPATLNVFTNEQIVKWGF